jgi:hypothetical protein
MNALAIAPHAALQSRLPRNASRLGWAALIVLPAIAFALRAHMSPWTFMWSLSIALFFGCKWETLVRAGSSGISVPLARSLAYFFLWPGMDAKAFLSAPKATEKPSGSRWPSASLNAIAGLACFVLAAHLAAQKPHMLDGWLAMLGIVLVLHFGTFQLAALAWRSAGLNARPIMQSPLRADSLSDFWGKRWNLGFSQMTRELVFRPLQSRIGAPAALMAAFIASGVIHDLVISVPARGGLGLPTIYFAFQGLAVLFERSSIGNRLGLAGGLGGRFYAFLCAAVPAPLLFHTFFVRRVILPFLSFAGSAILQGQGARTMTLAIFNCFTSLPAFFGLALWLAALGHFCVLVASFQVPFRLNWFTDLANLQPFNRKLMWVHGVFAVFTIIAFGSLTFLLHNELLAGEKSALGLAVFMAFYWIARIIVDLTYYDHADWPKGRSFVVGHVLLTLLFVFLAGTYTGLVLWHLARG